MTDFTVRVQLNGAPTSPTYERLHNAMATIGASRTISGTSARQVRLPHGEYNLSSTATAAVVRDAVVAVVAGIWAPYEILVTEAGERAWAGLQPHSALAEAMLGRI